MQHSKTTETNDFSTYSREDLLNMIRELQQENAQFLSNYANKDASTDAFCTKELCNKESFCYKEMSFRQKYAEKIFDSLPDMLTVVTDSGMTVAVVSAEETNHTGIPRDEIYGVNVSQFLPEHVYNHVIECIKQAIETGKSESMSHLMYIDGDPHYFENRTVRIDHDYNLCLCRDITEVMLAKGQLESLSYAVNQVNENIFSLNPEGKFLFANKQFLKDHQKKDVIGKSAVCVLFSCQKPEEWDKLKQSIYDNNGVLKYVTEIKNKTGDIVSYEIVAHSIRDINNDEEFWFFARDISLRLKQEKKISELNVLMEAILSNIPLYLFVKEATDYRYLYWNKSLEDHSGISASQAIGRTDFEIFHNQQDAEKFRKDDEELMRLNKRVQYIEEFTSRDGEVRDVKTIKIPIHQEGGKSLLLGTSIDITDIKTVEKELRAAKIEAEQSNRLKSAFLANMSHEIRTPLNAIVGFAKLILMEEDRSVQEEYSEIIDRNADLLLQLINDILDLSKIEAGTLDFSYKDVDFNELCCDMLEVHRMKVQPGVSLIYEGSHEKGFVIENDRNRLAQVFTNLLSNAIKFTTSGEIRFGYTVKWGMIEAFVRDTGMGISTEKVSSIFERFVKLNNFVQGTGLGLAITRTIIEKLGGSISVESVEGKGTEFKFTIPYHEVEDTHTNTNKVIVDKTVQETSPNQTKSSEKKMIMIVEDNESNYRLLQKHIGNKYAHCHAKNGLEAIDLFKKHNPDLILMDIKMPIMDGIEATKCIRNLSTEVPIVALTAFAYESDKKNVLNAGCNHFLTKPLSFSLLKSLIKEYLDNN